jgi:hypothetical protein
MGLWLTFRHGQYLQASNGTIIRNQWSGRGTVDIYIPTFA